MYLQHDKERILYLFIYSFKERGVVNTLMNLTEVATYVHKMCTLCKLFSYIHV